MDPNKLLARIRELVIEIEALPPGAFPHQAAELAEAIGNLDAWMSRGSALPELWQEKRK